MECNKDEALRAKSIAEGKLERKDFAGAKKFALKAQSLYPGLDGIAQMLTTVNVYMSAENEIGGEVDWYGVLGINPSDDDETLKKQYRKLALMLHPDKNKSLGADGAFKLVSEAWCFLSDKTKRLAYNQRRSLRGFQQNDPMQGGVSSAPRRENGNFNFASRETSVPKTSKNSAKSAQPPTAPPPSRRNDTFWTVCHQCLMHYEYLKKYRNQMLLCPSCHKPFMACETAPPFNYYKPSNQVPRQRQHTSSDHNPNRNVFDLGEDAQATQKAAPDQAGSNSTRYTYYHHSPLSGTGNVSSTDPSIAAKAANVVQQAQDKLKRAYTESNASAGWGEHAKKRNLDEGSSHYGMNYYTTQGNGGFGTTSGSVPGSRMYGPVTSHRQNVARDLTPYELRKILMERTRKEILNKLNMQKPETTAKVSNKQEGTSKGSKQRHESTTEVSGRNGDSALNTIKKADLLGESQTSISDDDDGKEDPISESISVPDPDFNDFDLGRMESSFGENEVWAAYDDNDGMPRIYALINKVISREPFKLRISWLNSKTNSEFSSIDWVGSGFYKTCGEFRVGRYDTFKTINAFSQKINWSKGPRGRILIFPQKGDVWALYKNWSPDWDENTADKVIHKYEMVTVLHDYNEDQGITVAPLVKELGFRTVFRPNMDSSVIRRISKEEMFRFSHRVQTHLLTGLEAENAPKGCLELDPAATPLELMTEGNEAPTVPDRANADIEVSQSVPVSALDGIVKGANAARAVNISGKSLEMN